MQDDSLYTHIHNDIFAYISLIIHKLQFIFVNAHFVDLLKLN